MLNFQNYSFNDFCGEIKSIVLQNIDELFLGSSQGGIDPEQYLENPNVSEVRFSLRTYDSTDWQLLALTSWHIAPIWGQILRQEIEEKIEKNKDISVKAKIYPLLRTKSSCLEFFYNFAPYSNGDWFGNVIKRMKKVIKLLKPKILKINPNFRIKRYSGYCRGYAPSRPAKKVEQQVLENQKIFYLRKDKEAAAEKIELLDSLLFLAGLSDNYEEVKRLLYEQAKQEFLAQMNF